MSEQNKNIAQSSETVAPRVLGLLIRPDGDPENWELDVLETCEEEFVQEQNEMMWNTAENLWLPLDQKNGHYRDCVWSNPKNRCGPDTCKCSNMRDKMVKQVVDGEIITTILPSKVNALKDRAELQVAQGRAQSQYVRKMSWIMQRRALRYDSYMRRLARYVRGCDNTIVGYTPNDYVEDAIRHFIRSSPSDCSGRTHMCVFGYQYGKAVDCALCPLYYEDRKRLCIAARYIRSYLNWLENDGQVDLGEVEETMADAPKKKKKGARKFDKLKADTETYKYHAQGTSHKPYWKGPSPDEVLQWSVSERAERAFKKACGLRFKNFQMKEKVTLNEAFQCYALFEPVIYDRKGLGCPRDMEHHRVYVFDRVSAKVEYAKQRGMPDFGWVRMPKFIERANARKVCEKGDGKKEEPDWLTTYQYLIRTYANKVSRGSFALQAYQLTLRKCFDVTKQGLVEVYDEYKWMSPKGVLLFLATVKQIGLCSHEDLSAVHDAYHEADKSAPYVQTQGIGRQLMQSGDWRTDKGEVFEMINHALQVLDYRINFVRSVMERFRLPGKVDYSMMDPIVCMPWIWHKFVCARLQNSKECKCLNGKKYEPSYLRSKQRDRSPVEVYEETMLSASMAGAGAQLLADPKIRSEAAGVFAEVVDPHFLKMTDLIEQAVKSGNDVAFGANATMFKSMQFMNKMEGLMDKVNPIVDKIAPTAYKVASGLDTAASWIETIISGIKNFIPGISSFAGMPDNWWQGVDTSMVIALVDAYIQWAHCKNKTVRAYIILKTLYLTGLIHKIVPACMYAWEQVQKYFVEETDDDGTSGPQSWWEMLTTAFDTMDLKKASWFVGFATILLCGVKIPFVDMKNIGKKIMGMLTTMHFVGLGLLGGKRIFEYVHTTLLCVVDWMRANVFKLPARTNPDVAEVAKWAARVKFFITEAGIRTMKLSREAMKEAQEIYPRGVEYYLRSQRDSTWLGVDMTRMVSMLMKDAMTITNVIHRIKTYTNFRPTMFHIQFVGTPGCGKSTLTTAVIKHMKDKLFPSLPDDNMVYALNDCEYFDGYNGQTFVVGDDLWKYNDAKHGTAIIGLITNTPVQLPQSHLEDKGQYLDSEVMISSVNDPYFHFKDVVDQNAIWRRRHLLAELVIDKRVMDESTHKFDEGLFKKFYPGQSSADWPHVTFNMLKPVPNVMDPHEHCFRDGTPNIPAKCAAGLYDEHDPLPKGIKVPLVNLTFEQLLEKAESRYRAMREEEKKILPFQQKQLMEQCWTEIDDAIDSAYGGNPSSRFLQGLFMPPEVNLDAGVETNAVDGSLEQQLIENVYEEQVSQVLDMPEPASVSSGEDREENLFELPSEISIGTAEETMMDAQSEFDTACSSEEGLSLDAEQRRRERLLRQKGRSGRPLQGEQVPIEQVDPVRGVVKIEGRWYMHISSNYKPYGNMYGRTVNQTMLDNARERGLEGMQELMLFQRQMGGRREFMKVIGDDSVDAMIKSSFIRLKPSADVATSFAQRASRLKWEFVRRCVKRNGEWYWSLDHLERAIMHSNVVWAGATVSERATAEELLEVEGIAKDEVVFFRRGNAAGLCYIAFSEIVLGNSEVYDSFCLFMDEFNDEQRSLMVDTTKSVIRKFGQKFWTANTTTEVRTWIAEQLRKIRRFGMWFWETFIGEGRWLLSLSVAMAVITIGIHIGTLFTPDPYSETSKVLFKARSTRPLIGKYTDASHNFGQQVESLVRRNLTKLAIGGRTFTGVKSGQYIYTVKHALREVMKKNEPFELEYLPSVFGQQGWTVEIDPSQVNMVEQADFAVIYSPNLPSARCIDEWFVEEADLQQLHDDEVVHTYFDAAGVPVVTTKKPRSMQTSVHMITPSGHEDDHRWMVCMDAPAVPGSSGGPVMTSRSRAGARTIFGIQSLNKAPWSFAQCVTQDMIEKAKQKICYKRAPIIDEGPLVCDETVLTRMESHVSEHLDVAGYVDKKFRAGAFGETKFVKTPFAGFVETDHVPAILSVKHPRVSPGQHPLAHSINKFGRDVMTSLPTKLLNQATRDVARYIKNRIGHPELRLMEFSEIVLGHDHPGSGPMNLKTSPGLPYVNMPRTEKGKRTWISTDAEGMIDKLDPQIVQDFEETEQAMQQGVILPNSMYEFAKDELRPIAKAYGGNGAPIKTRSISVLNMTHMMLFRKYHLDLTAHMHIAADGDFQSCVGINPEGPEWMRMFQNLSNMSSVNCFDLDVGNWDGHFTPQLFFAVVKVVNGLYGCEEDSVEATVRYAIAHAALFGYDQIEDMVFKKMRGMPSGFGGTAIYNTIGHMLVYYVFWLLCCERSGHPECKNWNAYEANCCVRFYGDDVVCSVHENVIDWFNVNTIAALYEEHGWPTTSAAKGSGMGSADIFSVQFLKRKFVFDEELGSACVHGSIDRSVIKNLLVWMRVNSRTVCREQMLQNVHSAHQFQFAKGEKAYMELFELCNRVLSMYGYTAYYIDYECMRECMLFERFGIQMGVQSANLAHNELA
jgi:hypothetical protein